MGNTHTFWVSRELDYSPFGMTLVGRSWSGGSEYRYGFNSQEQDDDVYGNGNLNTAEFWGYDTRLGRRWNIDPKSIASFSSYGVFYCNPILYSDIDGDTVKYGSFIDRIAVGITRVFNKNFNRNFNAQKGSQDVYTYSLQKNKPTLPNARPEMNAHDDQYGSLFLGYDIKYSLGLGISFKTVTIELGKNNECVEVNKEKKVNYDTEDLQDMETHKFRLNGRCDNTTVTINSNDNPDAFQIDDKTNDVNVFPYTILGPPAEYNNVTNYPITITPITNGKMVVTVVSVYDIQTINGNRKSTSKFDVTYWKKSGIHIKFNIIIPKF